MAVISPLNTAQDFSKHFESPAWPVPFMTLSVHGCIQGLPANRRPAAPRHPPIRAEVSKMAESVYLGCAERGAQWPVPWCGSVAGSMPAEKLGGSGGPQPATELVLHYK